MSPVTSDVVILGWKTLAPSDDNARKIAEFMGAEVTVVFAASARDLGSIRQLVPPCAALIVHADTLVRMAEVLATGVDGLLTLLDLVPHLFVYGFDSTDRHAAILTALSSGSLLGLEPRPTSDGAFQVSDSCREWCSQFSGLPIRADDPVRAACFIEGSPRDGQSALVRAAGRPFLVRVDRGKSDVFLVACSELGDLDEKVAGQASLLPWFSRLIPLMIFLRRALGNRAWHSDCSQACFIIDDPLLKRRYGFLDYEKLLETMGQQSFATSIAFIPWNYRRSRKQIAHLFSSAAESLSLCVHGCDHTGAEFAAQDLELLRGKARLALDRMQAHARLSGLPFDAVMVFPQGLFSREALQALDACGYLAAVNTDVCPAGMPQAVRLRERLDVAITGWGGVPLFARHYPRDPAEFAFDLFMGKPALVVEHHGYFRNGYQELGAFMRRLNQLDRKLEWRNLATICSRACLQRVTPDGDVHVRFYTNRFSLTNSGAQAHKYVLFRRHTSKEPLPTVAVNGRQWVREQKDDSLAITLSLDPGQTADIRTFPGRPADAAVSKPTTTHNARVFARRMLCEFRDNYVDTHRSLAGLLAGTRSLRAWGKGVFRSTPGATRIEG